MIVADQQKRIMVLEKFAKEMSRQNYQLRDEIEQLQKVREAAESLVNYVQSELIKHEGWPQFDFFPEKFDLYWFYNLERSLPTNNKAP